MFFSRTLARLGGLVGGDRGLGAVYCTLVLATPGPASSPGTKHCSSLGVVRSNTALLLYRLLAARQDTTTAAQTAHALLGLVRDLQLCRDLQDRSHSAGEFRINKTIL